MTNVLTVLEDVMVVAISIFQMSKPGPIGDGRACPRPHTSRGPRQGSAEAAWPRPSLLPPRLSITKAAWPRTPTGWGAASQGPEHKSRVFRGTAPRSDL